MTLLLAALALTGCFHDAPTDTADVPVTGDSGATTDTAVATDDTAGSEDTGTPVDDTGAEEPDATALTLTDAGNLALTDDLELAVVGVTGGTDLLFDWTNVRVDLTGNPVGGTLDRSTIQLTQLHVDDSAKIEEMLLSGPLTAEEVGFAYGMVGQGTTTSYLSGLYSIMNMVDPLVAMSPDSGFWLLSLFDNVGNTYALTVLDTKSEVGGTSVDLSSPASVLTAKGSFTDSATLLSPKLPTRIDWSDLTRTAAGRDWAAWNVDTLTITQFHGMSVDGVAQQLAQGHYLQVDSWTTRTNGRTSLEDLSELTGAQGTFPGFTPDEIWVVSLYCSTCYVPQPLYSAQIKTQ